MRPPFASVGWRLSGPPVDKPPIMSGDSPSADRKGPNYWPCPSAPAVRATASAERPGSARKRGARGRGRGGAAGVPIAAVTAAARAAGLIPTGPSRPARPGRARLAACRRLPSARHRPGPGASEPGTPSAPGPTAAGERSRFGRSSSSAAFQHRKRSRPRLNRFFTIFGDTGATCLRGPARANRWQLPKARAGEWAALPVALLRAPPSSQPSESAARGSGIRGGT